MNGVRPVIEYTNEHSQRDQSIMSGRGALLNSKIQMQLILLPRIMETSIDKESDCSRAINQLAYWLSKIVIFDLYQAMEAAVCSLF